MRANMQFELLFPVPCTEQVFIKTDYKPNLSKKKFKNHREPQEYRDWSN